MLIKTLSSILTVEKNTIQIQPRTKRVDNSFYHINTEVYFFQINILAHIMNSNSKVSEVIIMCLSKKKK